MTTVMTTVKEVQDEFFELVDRIQSPFVDFMSDMFESVSDFVPERPAWPFLAQVPTVNEVVENQIDFVTKFVDQQAGFARKMVKAASPVLVKLEAKPVRTVRKPRKATPAAA